MTLILAIVIALGPWQRESFGRTLDGNVRWLTWRWCGRRANASRLVVRVVFSFLLELLASEVVNL